MAVGASDVRDAVRRHDEVVAEQRPLISRQESAAFPSPNSPVDSVDACGVRGGEVSARGAAGARLASGAVLAEVESLPTFEVVEFIENLGVSGSKPSKEWWCG
jgi:hypothetical protein